MWEERLTAKDIGLLVSNNFRKSPVEEALRLRALQELSAIPTDQLVQLAYIVSRLHHLGDLHKHVRLYIEHIVGPRRAEEPRSFTNRD